MKPVILFRRDFDSEGEMEIARQYLPVYEQRTEIPEGSWVIGRYSVLPFYRELEKDLENRGSQLINTRHEHRWIADFEYYYYYDLKDYTAKTWTDEDFHRCDYPGPFVLKGRTNSRKHQWKTHMFAQDKEAAHRVARELRGDAFIGPQGILYREYVPLKTLEVGIAGLPFANEWRLFFHKEALLSSGFYWTVCDCPEKAELTAEGLAFAREVARIAADHVSFVVVDIAEKAEGGWVLIELNDGQMSGLSFNDPHVLYRALSEIQPPAR